MTSSHGVAVVCAMFLWVGVHTPDASAKLKTLPEAGALARYEIRLLGVKLGEPEVQVGAVEKLKDGSRVRRFKADAGVSELLQSVYRFDTKITAVFDAETYRALQSRIEMVRGSEHKILNFRYREEKLDGSLEKEGKIRTVSENAKGGWADTITAMYWLTAQEVAPAEEMLINLSSIAKKYRLLIRGGNVEQVVVPAGSFRAQRVDCILHNWWDGELSSEAMAAREPRTQWTLWFAQDADHTPVRLYATVGILGGIQVNLLQRKRAKK